MTDAHISQDQPGPDRSTDRKGPRDEDNFFKLLPQFFLIPLAVVLVCVGVFYLFGSIAFESRTMDDLITVLETRVGPMETHPRWQASYELAMRLTRHGDRLGAAQTRRLLDVYSEPGLEPKARGFLALTLSYCSGEAVDRALMASLSDSEPEVRRHAAYALGHRFQLIREDEMNPDDAGPPAPSTTLDGNEAAAALAPLLADDDRMTRSYVLGSLGEIGTAESGEVIKRALADKAGDVRLNAALALTQLRVPDATGLTVLLAALEPQGLQSLGDYTEDQALSATESVIHALADLNATEALAPLERVAESHPDFRMRQAARDALDRIQTPAPNEKR